MTNMNTYTHTNNPENIYLWEQKKATWEVMCIRLTIIMKIFLFLWVKVSVEFSKDWGQSQKTVPYPQQLGLTAISGMGGSERYHWRKPRKYKSHPSKLLQPLFVSESKRTIQCLSLVLKKEYQHQLPSTCRMSFNICPTTWDAVQHLTVLFVSLFFFF